MANVSVSVVGKSELTVPAGSFNAYEIRITGADGTAQTMYARQEAPHILLKLDGGAQPIVIELTAIN